MPTDVAEPVYARRRSGNRWLMEPIVHRTAASLGLSPRQLRNTALVQPVDGVSIGRDEAGDLETVCRAILPVLPADSVFTHIASGRLRGWWLPYLPEAPLVACTRGEAPHLDRRGVYVRRCEIPKGHRTSVHAIPVASAEWTIIEMAEHLSLIDLVIAIDCALHRGETSVDSIRATMRKGRRGVPVLRRALDLCDGRSESPWESALRLLFVLSGIPVDPQVEIRDVNGVFVARVDLLVRGTKRIAEYDGGGHRDRDQHRDDLRREKECARLGFERFGYTEIEIRKNPLLIIRDAEQALGLQPRPSRLKFWDHEFEASSLSLSGRHALVRRLSRFARTTTPRPSRVASGADLHSSGADSSGDAA